MTALGIVSSNAVVLKRFSICGPVLPRQVEEKKKSLLGRHVDSHVRNAELHSLGAALDLPKATGLY